ncbi:MAG: LysR family transcriptional regulator [Devosiaceae bacterium]|nr:LysR family transcriptional regulator [Devosiaceae bacterium]
MNRASPDWTLWRSFAAVIDHCSLSAAARHLDLSQPTLGRHIQALETSLNTPLFTRTLKGLEPNSSAMRLFEQVKVAQGALNEATLLAEGTTTKLEGSVRITASTITSHYILPGLLRKIRDQFPAIELELVPSDSAENLLMRESDIAVRMFRPTQLELIARKLGESPITCCAHQSYLERHGTPGEITELFDHDLVGFDRSDLLTSGAKSMGFNLARKDFALRTDSQTAIWELLRAGLGLGFAQHELVKATPGMVSLLPQLKVPPLQIWLTTHKELFTSRKIRVIYDLLADLLSNYFADK